MIRLDTGYIFELAGGVKGLLDGLDTHCPGHGVPYATIQMWRQRGSIPSQWIGAVLYVMSKHNISLPELLTDIEDLEPCGF